MKKLNEKRGNWIALLPFLIFVFVYLVSGIILQTKGIEMAFYQFPSPIATSIGIVFAFILIEGSLDEKFNVFIKGCGDDNIIINCILKSYAFRYGVVFAFIDIYGKNKI